MKLLITVEFDTTKESLLKGKTKEEIVKYIEEETLPEDYGGVLKLVKIEEPSSTTDKSISSDSELYSINRKVLVDRLVATYYRRRSINDDAAAAFICDTVLDITGALFGEVRAAAARK